MAHNITVIKLEPQGFSVVVTKINVIPDPALATDDLTSVYVAPIGDRCLQVFERVGINRSGPLITTINCARTNYAAIVAACKNLGRRLEYIYIADKVPPSDVTTWP